jgi:septal ring factor EnvC (AmiA/AmiB activator)
MTLLCDLIALSARHEKRIATLNEELSSTRSAIVELKSARDIIAVHESSMTEIKEMMVECATELRSCQHQLTTQQHEHINTVKLLRSQIDAHVNEVARLRAHTITLQVPLILSINPLFLVSNN